MRLFRIGLLLLFPNVLMAQEIVLRDFADKYDRILVEEIAPKFRKLPGKDTIERAEAYVSDPAVPDFGKYVVRRWIAATAEDIEYRNRLCEQLRVKPDDFVTRGLCVGFGKLALPEKRQKLEEIFEAAIKNHDGSYAASKVGSYLLDILWMQNDIASARIVYKKALEHTPKGDSVSILTLKQNLALIYTNTSNSPKIVHEGLKLYEELEAFYRDQNKPDADSFHLIAYNEGIAKFIPLEDYEGALGNFQKLPPEHRLYTDARIMSALSQIRLGRLKEAKKSLREVDFANYPDPERVPFLKCYEAIAHQELGLTQDLSLCVHLPVDTQANRILHITKVLSSKTLDPATEIGLWRQYWLFYTQKIVPQLQVQSEAQVNAMELERAKADSQIKDLELKNFALLKVLFAVAIAALLINAVFFLRLRAKNMKIQKLQTYIHKSVLGRFLPPVLVEEIIQGKSRMESKPSEELITVLFSDMVGFTSLSNQLGAVGSAEILNRYMRKMTEIIYKHQGTIDKFMGDAVMVIFGAPMPLPAKDQAERAIACAMDMILAMETINLEFKREFNIEVDVRIGINQGPAIVGTFGDEKRSDYTAIGPTVNLASRIEGVATPHEVLISPDVAKHLASFSIETRGSFRLKGIAEEVDLFAVRKVSG